MMVVISEPIEFVWDKGNSDKNLRKHNISDQEAEEAFEDDKKKTFPDRLHSGNEERFRIIGKTKNQRLLFVAFTIRGGKVRIISARKINKKEVILYEKIA